ARRRDRRDAGHCRRSRRGVPSPPAPPRRDGSPVVSPRLGGWIATRSARERALLMVAGSTTVVVLVVAVALGLRADLVALQAHVATRERELATLRRLAADLGPVPVDTARADARSLVTRLETAATAVVGRPRIAAMTPTPAPLPEALREGRVAGRRGATAPGERRARGRAGVCAAPRGGGAGAGWAAGRARPRPCRSPGSRCASTPTIRAISRPRWRSRRSCPPRSRDAERAPGRRRRGAVPDRARA